MTIPTNLFFSYSHKDETLRDELATHLALLRRQRIILEWHDRCVGAGQDWKDTIDANLNAAGVILLLVSADFLASDYCYDVEMKQALARCERGEAEVIPVILRACDWTNAPFAKLQALPTDGKPVMTWSNRDEAWHNVVRGIRAAVEAQAQTLSDCSTTASDSDNIASTVRDNSPRPADREVSLHGSMVNIHVTGNVINSDITGIRIQVANGAEMSVTPNSLCASVLSEYLGLSCLQEIESRFDIRRAKQEGNVINCRRVVEIWEHVLRSDYAIQGEKQLRPGWVVTVSDVQLIEFVNRIPGFAYKHRWRRKHLDDHPHNPLPGLFGEDLHSAALTSSWAQLAGLPSRCVSLFGLGDVRFGPSSNGLHLLSIVTPGLAPKISSTFGSSSIRPSALAQALSEQIQRLYLAWWERPKGEAIDAVSLGGFPVVATTEVYAEIADLFHRFGAVRLKTLTGILKQVPSVFPLGHPRGIPQWCLFLADKELLDSPAEPESTVCSAWTVTGKEELLPSRSAMSKAEPRKRLKSAVSRLTAGIRKSREKYDDKYLQWMFEVGVADWRHRLESAVEIIETVKTKVGATALFEFDEERNWFGEYTPFTPPTIRDLMHKMLKN